MTKTILKISIISGLILSTILFALFYTSNKKITPPKQDADKDRLEDVNDTFTAYMGRDWPYVLAIIYILIGLLCAFIYMYIGKTSEQTTVNISEKYSKILGITFIVFIVCFCVLVSVIAANSYMNDVQDDEQEMSEYTKEENKEKRQQYVTVIGLVVLATFIMFFLTKYMIKKVFKK